MNKESKRNKFIRIAEARTNKIISMIQLLANPASYEYTEKDVSDIFNTIEKEVRIAKSKFNASDGKESKFKLSR